jgi:hypothetical protein
MIADKYIEFFRQASPLNPIKSKDGITMTEKLQKMAVATAILGWGATSVKSAEAASVKLTFFQGADTPVGVGSFSYDESTPYEAIFPSRGVGRFPLEIKPSDKLFVVQDFAVNLLGLSWNLSQATVGDRGTRLSPFLWAPFDRRQLQFVRAIFPPFGSGEPNLGDFWAFGDIRRTYLVILGNSDGPGARMMWQQNDVQSNGRYFNNGYVIAEEVGPGGENPEPVPEPATTAGLAMAAAGLG